MFQAMTNSLKFLQPWLGELETGAAPFYRLRGGPTYCTKIYFASGGGNIGGDP